MHVISLSLAHLGLGILIASALIGLREVGRGFFTLCGFAGTGLTILGWVLSRSDDAGLQPLAGSGSSASPATAGGMSVFWQAAAVVVFLAGWIALRARRRDFAAPFHHASGAIAAIAVGSQGWLLAARSSAPAGWSLLAGADFLLSAALLGGVTVAMILGHWYLVQPGLAITPLMRLSLVFIILLGARTIMEAADAAGAVAMGRLSLSPPPGEILAFPALVLAQRTLFGLIGPLILAPLVYRTVASRSTMSATGLLYVAVALVWVGEFLSKYLLLPLRLV